MINPVGDGVAAPSPATLPTAGYIALLAVVFFAAFIGSCALLGRLLPFPLVPFVRDKMEQFTRFGDEYDLIFLGSSRVNFQIMPEIFDRIAREQGTPVRSFNAGVAAMTPPEDSYYLDQILRRPHRRLRWAILEIIPLVTKGDPIVAGTRRMTYWRDWERTRFLTERFVEDWTDACHDRDRHGAQWSAVLQGCAQALGVWLENLGLFAERFSNYGRGEELLGHEFGQTKGLKDISLDEGRTWNGWAFPRIAKPLTASEERRTAYERLYASLLETKQRFDPGDAVSWEALRIKIARLRAAHVTPILLIPPTAAPKRYFPPQLAGESLAIFDFSDPRKYPELFTVEHRLDGMHLNADGAKVFTEDLVQRFVEVAKKTDSAP